ncbi:MAG TPA: heme anaerobic degradation radical SAM methyltransferase ChuW/HutW [Desulfobacteraceae bacterium]|nr:heme anaerobic degradation radical SAM methyltransferase ChuW/HutW [Desulfobacteraceae bacterium]
MTQWLKLLNDQQRKLIFGNEQSTDPATAYDKKRAVHAGVKGDSVPADQVQTVWQREMEQSLPAPEDACVYINIPFCQSKCTYCGFFKNLADPAKIADYTTALIEEIAQTSSSPMIDQTRIRAVYIGGGTPGTLNAAQIAQLLTAINRHLPLANDCEITFETRTHDLGGDKLQACIEHGVNRFSLGVQSFDTRSRRSIGRIDSGSAVINNIQRMLALKQASVSIDLIFGLPHQSIDTYLEDIVIADQLGVDGMALYQLNVFEGGRMDKSISAGRSIAVPKTAEQFHYHQAAYNLLTDMGYHQLSMSHWVQGTLDRSIYNRFSKLGKIIHAFGAGAGGRTGHYRYFVHPSVVAYLEKINQGNKPLMGMTEKIQMTTLHDFISGQIDGGKLRFDIARKRFNIDLKQIYAPLLASWEQRGLAAAGERTLRLLPAGQFWYVNMNQALLDILEIILTNGAYELPQERVAAQG